MKFLSAVALTSLLSAASVQADEHEHEDFGDMMSAEQAAKFDLKFTALEKDCYARVTLTNKDNQTHYIVLLDSPFEKPISNRVFHGDNGAVYGGLIAENGLSKIQKQDVVAIEAGSSHSSDVNICSLMNFPGAGNYSITVDFDMMTIPVPDQTSLEEALKEGVTEADTLQADLESNPLVLQRTAASVAVEQEVAPPDNHGRLLKTPSLLRQVARQLASVPTSGCSSSQAQVIANAVANAKVSTRDSLTELPGGKWYSSYTKDLSYWLGTEASTRTNNDAKAYLSRTLAALNANQVTYVCGNSRCRSSVYAFVYPAYTSNKYVYLCNQFWYASTNKYARDSQPGTVVHELLHFDDIGNTDDHAYGTTAIRSLALNNPTKARSNSDNYEAFTETYAGEHGINRDQTKARCRYSPSSRYADCPSGYVNCGLTCFRPHSSYWKGCTTIFKKYHCRAGYTDMGCHCARHVHSLGLSSMTCKTGETKSFNRCYKPCDPEWYFRSGTCIRRERAGC
uniref:Lysine-specific metallo-endopeptidase domain-containing protein n=1 Tax=Mucochytrium quahogii TaxID=96639 RepID=A0A7S2SBH1_9STRA|mmetsp:Transcript_3512/g.7594  ORF Transcript_3512/g.7594 Transcript_3512/m.7594 type:complete len:509 (+) Transcript_3512:3026-4552(+)